MSAPSLTRKPKDPTFKSLLMENTCYGSRRLPEVFRDFCELSALAIRNRVDLHQRQEREQRYLQIVGNYTSEEETRFAQLLAIVASELVAGFDDVLGHHYMSLELGNDAMGQFFTPYHVSQLVAQMNCPDFAEHLNSKPFITVSEPTCGSGGMVVAFAEAMHRAGYDHTQQLHVSAQDLEATSVHMSYIALSLLGIPAVVTHGNTLSQEVRDRWATPAHIVGGWTQRLKRQ